MWKQANNRRLLYTAISRSEQKCILVGDKSVLDDMRTEKKDLFYTKFLKESNIYEL